MAAPHKAYPQGAPLHNGAKVLECQCVDFALDDGSKSGMISTILLHLIHRETVPLPLQAKGKAAIDQDDGLTNKNSPDGFAVGDLFLGILFQFDAVAKGGSYPFAKRYVRVVA